MCIEGILGEAVGHLLRPPIWAQQVNREDEPQAPIKGGYRIAYGGSGAGAGSG